MCVIWSTTIDEKKREICRERERTSVPLTASEKQGKRIKSHEYNQKYPEENMRKPPKADNRKSTQNKTPRKSISRLIFVTFLHFLSHFSFSQENRHRLTKAENSETERPCFKPVLHATTEPRNHCTKWHDTHRDKESSLCMCLLGFDWRWLCVLRC